MLNVAIPEKSASYDRNPRENGFVQSSSPQNLIRTVVIPAKAGIHFDLDGRNMDSRLRGNDKCGACENDEKLRTALGALALRRNAARRQRFDSPQE